MNDKQAVTKLSALAHLHRLHIFRLLIEKGSSGIAAGEISETIDISTTSTSFHLKELERAGLITATRDGRYIRYSIIVEAIRDLLAFLTDDCCQGHPEICGVQVIPSSSKKAGRPDKQKTNLK